MSANPQHLLTPDPAGFQLQQSAVDHYLRGVAPSAAPLGAPPWPAEVEMNDLVDILSIQADTIEPLPNTEPALRDIDDLPVLGTFLSAFKASSADYLVTGDKDLLALSEHYPIMTPREFWTRHGGI